MKYLNLNGSADPSNPNYEKMVSINVEYPIGTPERIIYDCFETRHPFPHDTYQLIPYIAKSNGYIVCEGDELVPFSTSLKLECKLGIPSTFDEAPICGSGVFDDTSTSGAYSWSIWKYNNSKLDFWFNSGQYTSSEVPNGIYDITLDTTRLSQTAIKSNINVLCEGEEWMNRTTSQHAMRNTQHEIGPFAIFTIAMIEKAYLPYWGIPYNKHATASGNTTDNSYGRWSESYRDLRWYDGAKIWKDGELMAYYRTCYKKSTHQYGVYNQVTGVFYSSHLENINTPGNAFTYDTWINARTEPTRYQREREITQIYTRGGEGEGY